MRCFQVPRWFFSSQYSVLLGYRTGRTLPHPSLPSRLGVLDTSAPRRCSSDPVDPAVRASPLSKVAIPWRKRFGDSTGEAFVAVSNLANRFPGDFFVFSFLIAAPRTKDQGPPRSARVSEGGLKSKARPLLAFPPTPSLPSPETSFAPKEQPTTDH